MGDFGAYLASIDFRLAVLAAVVLVAIAAGLRMFILAATEEGLAALPLVGSWLARSALARRRELATRSWFCTTCRSLNPPSATLCYRGCGPREALEADGLPVDESVDALAGTSRRRG